MLTLDARPVFRLSNGRRVALVRQDGSVRRGRGSRPRRPCTWRGLLAVAGAVGRWSPDGSQIAVGATRGFTGGIFVIGADGRNERRLTPDGGWPVWWPGKGIAYLASTAGGGQEIRVVSLSGGESSPLEYVKFKGRKPSLRHLDVGCVAGDVERGSRFE